MHSATHRTNDDIRRTLDQLQQAIDQIQVREFNIWITNLLMQWPKIDVFCLNGTKGNGVTACTKLMRTIDRGHN